jgi:hypothetical protein
MPELINPSIRIHDLAHWRTRFKNVRINQLFYSRQRWWQKRTSRTAIRADDRSNEFAFFKGEQMIRVFDESRPMLNPVSGLSYEEFINRSAL